MFKKITASTLLILVLIININAIEMKAPEIDMKRNFGGYSWDKAKKVIKTQEGNFLVIGETHSKDKKIKHNQGRNDILVLKVNDDGREIWHKTYGEKYNDLVYDAIETEKGNFLIVGKSNMIFDRHEQNKFQTYILKIDKDGKILFEKRFGYSGDEAAYSVIETKEGFVIAGETNSLKIEKDGYVTVINKDGTLIFEKKINKNNMNFINAIEKYEDNYIVSEIENKDDIIKSYLTIYNEEFKEVRRIDIDQNVNGDTVIYDIKKTKDNGYLVFGTTKATNFKFGANKGKEDVFIIKYNELLEFDWTKMIGTKRKDYIYDAVEMNDGGFAFVGYTNNVDKEKRLNYDYLLVRVKKNGETLWTTNLGGVGEDIGYSISKTDNEELFVVGESNSKYGDVDYNIGSSDFWMFKLEEETKELKEESKKTTKNAKNMFIDISGNEWFYDYINELYLKGLISGYNDNTFKPNDEINIDAFITMIIKSKGFEFEYTGGYWAQPYIDKAKELNIIEDFDNYEEPINRIQMIKIIINALDKEIKNYTLDKDIEDIILLSEEEQKYLKTAYKYQITNGYEDGTFKPFDTAKRLEAAIIILKYLEENES